MQQTSPWTPMARRRSWSWQASRSETLKRVDRWDFTAEETQAAWQSSQLGDGLHLELPLGETVLPEGPLELWVRLVNAEGKKLLTRLPFAVGDLQPLDMASWERVRRRCPDRIGRGGSACGGRPDGERAAWGQWRAGGKWRFDQRGCSAAPPATQWRASTSSR